MSDIKTRIQVAVYSEFRRVPLPEGVLLFTSALSREGKTFITTSLAIAESYKLSMEKPVLFVDLSSYNQEGGSILTENKALPGVADIVGHGKKPEKCIHQTVVPNLFVLPYGNAPVGFEPITCLSALKILIGQLSEKYRIIIDTVPVFLRNRGNFDPVELSLLADATFLIILAGKTPMEVIQRSKLEIENAGGKLGGVIMNDRFVRPLRNELGMYLRWLEWIPFVKYPVRYLRARLGIY